MGVPVIGCDCAVCTSRDERNQRYRTSLMLTTTTGNHIVFDTTPEFRLQMLRAKVKHLHTVVYTHLHADHSHGFDDLRGVYFAHNEPLHIWAKQEDLDELKSRFAYAFENTGYHATKPDLRTHPIGDGPFVAEGLEVENLSLPHGNSQTLAFRIGNFAYATDFRRFEPHHIARWRGKIDTMVASGLRFRPHNTHSSIAETIDLFNALEVRRGIITHMSHDVEYVRDSQGLPPHISLAYDGMRVDL